ncbi:MAG: hypothetical protein DWH81_10180 [Planctomycetota bacterium]|nr:MAG: hypothetical protein DWH81_10180 [Planctomycetota bacterium]
MEGLLTIEVMNKWTEKSRVKYEVVTTIIQYPLKYDYMTKDRHTLLRKAGVTVYRASVERPVAFVVLRRSDLLASPARTENTKVVIAEFRSQVDKNADGIGDLSSCWVELPEVSKK